MTMITALSKAIYYNIKSYGALGNGTTDDSAAIASARSAANVTGGVVFWPAGTYITGNQPLYSNVTDVGAGASVTIIKLKNGANVDLFSAYTGNINLSGVALSGSSTGIVNAGFKDITLDGNKANQSSGTSYPLHFYGYHFSLTNVEITNGYTGGIFMDWNGTSDPAGLSVNNYWYHVEAHDNNGVGIRVGGPTDCKWISVNSFKNGSHNYHLAPNAVGYTLTNCHGWEAGPGVGAVCALVEGGAMYMVNCQIESSDTTQLVILGNDCSVIGGAIFSANNTLAATSVGIQLGQIAGQTPIPGQIYQAAGVTTAQQVWGTNINTKINDCWQGAVDYQNEAHSTVIINDFQSSGNVLHSGRFPSTTDYIMHTVSGLTPDGTMNKGSAFHQGLTSNEGVYYNATGAQMLNIAGSDTAINVPNNVVIRGWNGNYGALTYELHSDTGNIITPGNLVTSGLVKVGNSSSMYSGTGAPSNGTGANGDFYFRTDTPGTANQRIYVKSAGAWVGIV